MLSKIAVCMVVCMYYGLVQYSCCMTSRCFGEMERRGKQNENERKKIMKHADRRISIPSTRPSSNVLLALAVAPLASFVAKKEVRSSLLPKRFIEI